MAAPTYLAKDDFLKVGTGGSLLIDFGNYEDFDNFAYEIEEEYLTKLFGVRNKQLFDADRTLDKYADLFVKTDWNDGTNYYTYQGITKMLQYFFFFRYYTDIEQSIKTSSDAATAYIKTVEGVRDLSNLRMIKAYNKAVDYFNEIVDYIIYFNNETPEHYPQFDTIKMKKINIFGI